MKNFFSFIILVFMSCLSFGQTVGKVNRVEDPAKIGSVPVGSISSLGGVAVVTLYKNCSEILDNTPGASDGFYTIDPDGDGSIEPFNCFCDMTTDGGGWTMVGYYSGISTYQNLMVAQSDISYGAEVGNPNPSTVWSDWRVLAGTTWPAEFAVILDQPAFSSGWESYVAKVIYRVGSRNVLPNYGTVQDLTSGDNLYYKLNFASGWTDAGSSSASGGNYWYPRASSNAYLISFYDLSSGAYYGVGVPGGDNSWGHIARMFIR